MLETTLFAHFDFDRSGLIEYDEFLRAIRGPMSANRKAIAMRAFSKMDADGSGMIDINDIRGVYTADKHPDVMAGKKTEQQVLSEFLETFETAHSMRNQRYTSAHALVVTSRVCRWCRNRVIGVVGVLRSV